MNETADVIDHDADPRQGMDCRTGKYPMDFPSQYLLQCISTYSSPNTLSNKAGIMTGRKKANNKKQNKQNKSEKDQPMMFTNRQRKIIFPECN